MVACKKLKPLGAVQIVRTQFSKGALLIEVLALIVEGPDLHSMREWMGLSRKPSHMKFHVRYNLLIVKLVCWYK